MENNEKLLFSNSFGSVTDKRVILNYKNGAEDIPIGQITSISYQHKRNYFLSIGSFIISIFTVVIIVSASDRLGPPFITVCLLIFILGFLAGIAHWIGHHNIKLSAGGKDRKPLRAEMSKTKEGREFVNAIKKAVIK
jgi:hypothetical protein